MSAQKANLEDQVQMLEPLGHLPPRAQAEILADSSVLRYQRGEFVFHEGDRDDYAFYLLEGRLELLSGGNTVKRIEGGSEDSRHALAQLQPRKMSGRAEGDVTILQVDRAKLDSFAASISSTDYCPIEVDDIEAASTDDWMTRMLQSELFTQLPVANIQRVFSLFETVEIAQGEFVVHQDEPGDYYYVLVQGRAEVSRAAGPKAPSYRLALIGTGDSDRKRVV